MLTFELLLSAAVFAAGLEKRKKPLWLPGAVAIVWLLYTAGNKDLRGGMPAALLWNILRNAAVIFFIFAGIWVLIYALCKVSLVEALYTATCGYLAEHIAYCLRLLVDAAAGEMVADSFRQPLYWVCHLGTCTLCYVFFARRMLRKKHYRTSSKRMVLLFLPGITVILVMSLLAATFGERFLAVHAVYGLTFCFFALYSQVEMQRQLSYQKELLIEQQLHQSAQRQYKTYTDAVGTFGKSIHDLMHLLSNLRKTETDEAQVAAIDGIGDTLLCWDSFVETGNAVLNTVLTERNLHLASKGIAFTVQADGRDAGFLEDADLFLLCDALLTRAQEVELSCDPSRRSISFRAGKRLNLYLLEVSYTRPKENDKEAEFPPDLVLTAAKYQGVCSGENHETYRTDRVAIPVPEGK
ncbi:MAG: hypothetical protein SOH60_06940 [Lachnospiraceae bacterium]|jgi:hypothetical protein